MTIQLLTAVHPAFPPGHRTAVELERGQIVRIAYHHVGSVQRDGDRVVITTIQCYTFVCCAADYLALLGSQSAAQIAAWEYTDRARRPRYFAPCWGLA